MKKKLLYEVEQIVDKRTLKSKIYYLVKWRGFPIQQCTWEPLKNLQNAKSLIKQFDKKPKRQSDKPIKCERVTRRKLAIQKQARMYTETAQSQKANELVEPPTLFRLPLQIIDCQVDQGEIWYLVMIGSHRLRTQQAFLQEFYDKEFSDYKCREFQAKVLKEHQKEQRRDMLHVDRGCLESEQLMNDW